MATLAGRRRSGTAGIGIAVTAILFRLQEGRLRRISEDSSIRKRVWDAGVLVPVLER